MAVETLNPSVEPPNDTTPSRQFYDAVKTNAEFGQYIPDDYWVFVRNMAKPEFAQNFYNAISENKEFKSALPEVGVFQNAFSNEYKDMRVGRKGILSRPAEEKETDVIVDGKRPEPYPDEMLAPSEKAMRAVKIGDRDFRDEYVEGQRIDEIQAQQPSERPPGWLSWDRKLMLEYDERQRLLDKADKAKKDKASHNLEEKGVEVDFDWSIAPSSPPLAKAQVEKRKKLEEEQKKLFDELRETPEFKKEFKKNMEESLKKDPDLIYDYNEDGKRKSTLIESTKRKLDKRGIQIKEKTQEESLLTQVQRQKAREEAPENKRKKIMAYKTYAREAIKEIDNLLNNAKFTDEKTFDSPRGDTEIVKKDSKQRQLVAARDMLENILSIPYDAPDEMWTNVVRGIGENAFAAIPYIGQMKEIFQNTEVIDAYEKKEQDLASNILLEAYKKKGLQYTEEDLKPPRAYTVGQSLPAIVGYMGEYVTSAGVASAARTGVTKYLTSTVGKKLLETIGKTATKRSIGAVSELIGAAAQTAVNPQTVVNNVTQRLAPQMVTILGLWDDSGLPAQTLKDGEEFSTALKNGIGLSYLEFLTERFGEHVPKGMLKSSDLFRKVTILEWARKKGLSSSKAINKAFKRAGWNGVIAETWIEEYPNRVLGNLLTGDQKMSEVMNPFDEEMMNTFFSMLAIPGGKAALRAPLTSVQLAGGAYQDVSKGVESARIAIGQQLPSYQINGKEITQATAEDLIAIGSIDGLTINNDDVLEGQLRNKAATMVSSGEGQIGGGANIAVADFAEQAAEEEKRFDSTQPQEGSTFTGENAKKEPVKYKNESGVWKSQLKDGSWRNVAGGKQKQINDEYIAEKTAEYDERNEAEETPAKEEVAQETVDTKEEAETEESISEPDADVLLKGLTKLNIEPLAEPMVTETKDSKTFTYTMEDDSQVSVSFKKGKKGQMLSTGAKITQDTRTKPQEDASKKSSAEKVSLGDKSTPSEGVREQDTKRKEAAQKKESENKVEEAVVNKRKIMRSKAYKEASKKERAEMRDDADAAIMDSRDVLPEQKEKKASTPTATENASNTSKALRSQQSTTTSREEERTEKKKRGQEKESKGKPTRSVEPLSPKEQSDRKIRSVGELITRLSKIANIKVKFRKAYEGGRKGLSVLGEYVYQFREIAVKFENDLSTLIHEIGHGMHDQYKMTTSEEAQMALNKKYKRGNDSYTLMEIGEWGSTPQGVKQSEMDAFVEMYNESPQEARAAFPEIASYMEKEAVAEFFKMWLVSPNQAKAQYPDFYEYFMKTVPVKKLNKFNELGKDIRALVHAPASVQIISNSTLSRTEKRKFLDWKTKDPHEMAMGERKFLGWRATAWDTFQTVMVNDLHIFEKVTKLAAQSVGIDLTDIRNAHLDPMISNQLLAGVHSKMDDWITNGMSDFGTLKRKRFSDGKVMNFKNLMGEFMIDKFSEDKKQSFSWGVAERTIEILNRRFDSLPSDLKKQLISFIDNNIDKFIGKTYGEFANDVANKFEPLMKKAEREAADKAIGKVNAEVVAKQRIYTKKAETAKTDKSRRRIESDAKLALKRADKARKRAIEEVRIEFGSLGVMNAETGKRAKPKGYRQVLVDMIVERETATVSGLGAGFTSDMSISRAAMLEQKEMKKEDPERYGRMKESIKKYREMSDALLEYAVQGGRMKEIVRAKAKRGDSFIDEDGTTFIKIKKGWVTMRGYQVDAARAKELDDIYEQEHGEIIGGKQYINQRNESYYAMNRIQRAQVDEAWEDVVPVYQASSGSNVAKSIIKKSKGSALEIKDSYESLIDNMYKFMKEVDNNHVKAMFVNLLTRNPREAEDDFGGKEALGNFISKDIKDGGAGKNAITVFQNGEKKRYSIANKELFKAFEGMNGYEDGILMKLITWVKRFMQKAIINTPQFAMRNVMRDVQSRYILGASTPATDIALMKSGKYQERLSQYRLLGGGQFGYFTRDVQRSLKNIEKSHIKDANKAHRGGLEAISDTGLNIVKFMFGEGAKQGEELNRVAEFDAQYNIALRKYKDAMQTATLSGLDEYNATMYAAWKARELIDFARGGTMIKVINRYVPFANAAYQGLYAGYRSAKTNPAAFTTRMLTVSLIPAIIEQALLDLFGDEDDVKAYNQLASYRKDYFYNFRIFGMFISPPKAFELGLFSSFATRLYRRAMGDENALEGFYFSAFDSLVPLFYRPTSLLGIATPIVEIMTNRDTFRDIYIVPPYEATRPWDERYGAEEASALSIFLTRHGQVLDPRYVDKFVKGFGGHYGKMLLQASDILYDTLRSPTEMELKMAVHTGRPAKRTLRDNNLFYESLLIFAGLGHTDSVAGARDMIEIYNLDNEIKIKMKTVEGYRSSVDLFLRAVLLNGYNMNDDGVMLTREQQKKNAVFLRNRMITLRKSLEIVKEQIDKNMPYKKKVDWLKTGKMRSIINKFN